MRNTSGVSVVIELTLESNESCFYHLLFGIILKVLGLHRDDVRINKYK